MKRVWGKDVGTPFPTEQKAGDLRRPYKLSKRLNQWPTTQVYLNNKALAAWLVI